MPNTIAYPTQQSPSPRGNPVLINEEMATESQQYNCFIKNGGNAIPKHAGPQAKGSSNPTAGLALLWARNQFRGNLNHWLVSSLPSVMKHYFPTGRRNYGRPLKRLLDT
jgi:hypothetical protein